MRVLPRDWDGQRLLRFLAGLAMLALAFAAPALRPAAVPTTTAPATTAPGTTVTGTTAPVTTVTGTTVTATTVTGTTVTATTVTGTTATVTPDEATTARPGIAAGRDITPTGARIHAFAATAPQVLPGTVAGLLTVAAALAALAAGVAPRVPGKRAPPVL